MAKVTTSRGLPVSPFVLQEIGKWNLKNRVGSQITFRIHFGAPYETTTRSCAMMDAEGGAVIFLRGISRPAPLDDVYLHASHKP